MRFVKSVPGEFLHQVEDFHRQFTVNAVLFRPVFKDGTLLGHLLRLFLTHRTTQHIRATEGVAREHLGYLHHLFLIQDDAVGRLQYRFQAFMLPLNIRVGDLFAPVLTVDKVIHHPRLQWARTEQGHERNHIFEAVRLQTLNQVFHAAGFKLEDRSGLRALQHVEAFLVIKRDSGDIQRRLAVFLSTGVDHLQRPVDDGERTQPQEVELHETCIFHIVLIKLGDRMLPCFITIERRKIGNFGRRNNHATGMFTSVTCDTFQFTRHVDQRFNFFVGFVNFRQLRFRFKRFRQRHPRIGRNQLGDTIHKTVRMPQHAAYVANNRFCRHRTEGDDLRYRITPVHIRHVVDNLIAFFHTEIDVKVGHGNTFRVKETFEQQVKFQRVEVGNFQRIGHQRSRTGTSPRPYRHTVIFRPLDKLHYDEEVAWKAHLVDNLEFNIQTLVILRTFLFTDRFIRKKECQTLFQSLFRLRNKKIFGGHVPGRELGQKILAQTHRDVTTLGNFYRVFQRFRDVGK